MRQPLRSEERDDPQGRLTPDTRAGRLLRPVLILVLAVALLAAAFSAKNPATRAAEGYARDIAMASAGTYLTLRTLNAFLSTAQELEVGGSFVVQGSAQPLKWLEPVDDTVERIAQVVFFVMVATGALSVALAPASGLGWAVLAGAALLALVTAGRGRGGHVARRMGLYGTFLALALPGAFLLSALLADRMTEEVWARHSAIVEEITAQVDPAVAVPSEGSGVMGALQGARMEFERYSSMAGALYDRSDALVQSLIALLAVFLFKVLVLPLLILAGAWIGLRALDGR